MDGLLIGLAAVAGRDGGREGGREGGRDRKSVFLRRREGGREGGRVGWCVF